MMCKGPHDEQALGETNTGKAKRRKPTSESLLLVKDPHGVGVRLSAGPGVRLVVGLKIAGSCIRQVNINSCPHVQMTSAPCRIVKQCRIVKHVTKIC